MDFQIDTIRKEPQQSTVKHKGQILTRVGDKPFYLQRILNYTNNWFLSRHPIEQNRTDGCGPWPKRKKLLTQTTIPIYN